MQRTVLWLWLLGFGTVWCQAVGNVAIDWTQVKPVQQLDHYWARVPAEWQFLRNISDQRTDAPSGGRITNGAEASAGQFPYQALLLVEFGALTTLCGGSVLTNHFILSAAHCVMLDQTTVAGAGTAIMGALNRLEQEPTQQRLRFGRTGIFVHPQYTASNLRFDVTVIRLGTAMVFNPWVQPIALPSRNDLRTFEGLIGTVSGFGRTSDATGGFSTTLRYTHNPILSNGACIDRWGSLLVEPQNICQSGDGGRSACNGDSGGPLTVLNGGRTLQVGVVSFGPDNGCTRGMPVVMARVSFFLDWIAANSDYVVS
ncbi:brachyurin-like [Anopheles albimanus]|uniref:Peptidase S1 domain-containing protein n=1 Tax=Anopheles albimanus TaxID=7167 RepID=A0A8W7K7K7_ANOAL|nr:brachyurin-like [Anopheles albimanus]